MIFITSWCVKNEEVMFRNVRSSQGCEFHVFREGRPGKTGKKMIKTELKRNKKQRVLTTKFEHILNVHGNAVSYTENCY